MTFNFFDIVEFDARREEDYSAVLKWLLDPGETHGLGSEVLRSVLEKVGLPAEEVCSSNTLTVDVERCLADAAGQRRGVVGLEQPQLGDAHQQPDRLDLASDGFAHVWIAPRT